MRNLTILGLILLFLAANCTATDPIRTGEKTGKAILENISGNASIPFNNSTQINDSIRSVNTTQLNASIQPANSTSIKDSTSTNSTINQTSNTTKKATSDLWSWGSVPAGYALDKSGNLVKLPTTEEWLPGL
jgi:hypothetical protein